MMARRLIVDLSPSPYGPEIREEENDRLVEGVIGFQLAGDDLTIIVAAHAYDPTMGLEIVGRDNRDGVELLETTCSNFGVRADWVDGREMIR